MAGKNLILSRREALAGIGLTSAAAIAHAAWSPVGRLIDGGTDGGTVIRVSSVRGADDVERIINAFQAAPEAATILFDAGSVSRIDRLISIGNGGDVGRAKGVRVVADGHQFIYTADGARIEFNGPISAVLDLATSYRSGSLTLTVSHAGRQLADFTPGSWIKIVSDVLDGWNRNRGNQAKQYRLGEWAQIRKVADNRNGTATLTLVNLLKFTRGFINVGNTHRLAEVDSYTTSNNARVFALSDEAFAWSGGTFFIENAESHLGPSGWNTRSLFRVQGFVSPVVQNVVLGPGVGKGLEIQGCVDFKVNSARIRGLPDFAAKTTKGSVKAGNLGYGVSIGGCWGGTVNNLVAMDCRHAITEGGSTATANASAYGLLMSIGRTYGTRVNNPRVSGRFAAAIDTHQGAHAWVISNPWIEGTQDGVGISLRGPGHIVYAPIIRAERGIQVFSEFENSGGGDLPGLVGKGNQWMTSAIVVGGSIDCVDDALSVRNAQLTIEGGMKIRVRARNAFTCSGGLLDFASGRIEVEVAGNPSANDNQSLSARDLVCTKSNPAYGITWMPKVVVRNGASIRVVR